MITGSTDANHSQGLQVDIGIDKFADGNHLKLMFYILGMLKFLFRTYALYNELGGPFKCRANMKIITIDDKDKERCFC